MKFFVNALENTKKKTRNKNKQYKIQYKKTGIYTLFVSAILLA